MRKYTRLNDRSIACRDPLIIVNEDLHDLPLDFRADGNDASISVRIVGILMSKVIDDLGSEIDPYTDERQGDQGSDEPLSSSKFLFFHSEFFDDD